MIKRKSFRFDPEENTLIKIKYTRNKKRKEKLGLVCDESFEGCSCIFRRPFPFDIGDEVKVVIGNVRGVKGKLIWTKDYDNVTVKAGFFISEDI
ncbi:MAG: hypothetical protein PVI26_12735 [Chitinispirillia bacterium]|jgi:hypothetical protein